MPDIQSLGPWLRRFFEEYLVTERNLARNTQISYRDTFKLLRAHSRFPGAVCKAKMDCEAGGG